MELQKSHRECIIGEAGTGKTFELKRRIKEDPKYALLCATTGAAAVNLGEGVSTLNSVIGYFDTKSLEQVYKRGMLGRRLKKVANNGFKNIAIDEMSMMDKEQFELIERSLEMLNEQGVGMGMILTGDFCQLPPVKADFVFKSSLWEEYRLNTTKLTRIWRQSDENFLKGINAARKGEGREAYLAIGECEGVTYLRDTPIEDFDGTTLFGTNSNVEEFNNKRLERLEGEKVSAKSYRWGKQLSEWKNIPERVWFCKGAYVMALANGQDLCYANGSCGHVKGWKEVKVEGVEESNINAIDVEFGARVETVGRIVRKAYEYDGEVLGKETPEYYMNPDEAGMGDGEYLKYLEDLTRQNYKKDDVYFDYVQGAWVIGWVNYLPIRLAYATTVHKSQGLSLDRVQIDFRERFFGSPGMLYVALSRVRTPEGLTLVGDMKSFVGNCRVNEEVRDWL